MYLLFQQRLVKRAAWQEAEVLVDDGGGNVAIRLKGPVSAEIRQGESSRGVGLPARHRSTRVRARIGVVIKISRDTENKLSG